ncbi:MAG: HutD family protein [Kofleriaceae bacterium]|nr:HutD family protein [Kofleriaceae bacterium]
MPWTLAAARDLVARPWGGGADGDGAGTSTEVWRWGTGQPPALRVSLATITRAGAFTAMPDRRRWLLVLDPGDGLALGGHTLAGGAVWTGPGAPPVRAALGGRAARVLNVISAAGVAVQPTVLIGPRTLDGAAGVLVATAPQQVQRRAGPLALDAGDALIADGPAEALVVPGPALWVPAPAPLAGA